MSEQTSGDEEQPTGEEDSKLAVGRAAAAATLAEDLIREGLLDRVPTDVSFVRYVHPDEQDRLRASCALKQGSHIDASRAITTSGVRLPAEAEYRLQVMYPVHPSYRAPYTEKQIRVLYDYYVNTLVPCLRREGYDAGPLPSWEFFHANFTPVPWSPYQRLSPVRTRMPIEQFEALQSRCPPQPPIHALFPHDEMGCQED